MIETGQNEISSTVEALLEELNLDKSCVRLGNTQVKTTPYCIFCFRLYDF